MTKKELRSIYKQKRLNLSDDECQALNSKIEAKFLGLSFHDIHNVLIYQPIHKWKEPKIPNIHLHINLRSVAQIAVPRIKPLQDTFEAVTIDEDTEYNLHKFDITEPTTGKVIQPMEIDLVIIPLLIFDQNGYRVGYGKGMYDKYLSMCSTNILKIGLSFFEPVERIDDTDAYDIPLDYCITPTHVYRFD